MCEKLHDDLHLRVRQANKKTCELKCACRYILTSFGLYVTRQYIYVNITHYTDLWFEYHKHLHTYSINELGNGFV